MNTRDQLIDRLKNDTRVLQNTRIENAFKSIDRVDFVHDDYKVEAYEDYPIPIGSGQTISQPTTVAFMLEKLNPQEGDRVLDVGCGSGWTTALLAHMVGGGGRVHGVDIIPELVSFGQENLKKYNFSHATIKQAGQGLGLSTEAPFDRILVSAAGADIPDVLVDQLKIGGVMVLPVGDTIIQLTKKSKTKVSQNTFPGFAFVPLVQ